MAGALGGRDEGYLIDKDSRKGMPLPPLGQRIHAEALPFKKIAISDRHTITRKTISMHLIQYSCFGCDTINSSIPPYETRLQISTRDFKLPGLPAA